MPGKKGMKSIACKRRRKERDEDKDSIFALVLGRN
jgi:hypothetical protein